MTTFGRTLSRRGFVGAAAAALAGVRYATLPAAAAPSGSQPQAAAPAPADLTLGIVLPAGTAALAGARFGAAEAKHAADLFGVTLTVRDYLPGADAADAARRAIDDGAIAVIGGATDAEAAQLGPLARTGAALVLNVGGAADALRTCEPLLFHIAPHEGMRRAARAALGEAAEGDAVLAWHPELSRFGAGQLNDRFRAAAGSGMDSAAWCAWMAVKVVWEATQRARTAEPRALAEYLAGDTAIFDGHKGVQLTFRSDTRQLRQPLYIVREDRVIAEVPVPALASSVPPAELLDRTAAAGDVQCAA